jgi:hypothetical protein
MKNEHASRIVSNSLIILMNLCRSLVLVLVIVILSLLAGNSWLALHTR